MKGCARTCLLWLIGWAAAGGAFFFYLRRLGEYTPQIWWASVIAGFCVVLVVSYVVGIWGFFKERSMLLGAMVGRPPNDGEWIAVSGPIHSNAPLKTPITGVSAVTYTYDVYRMETSRGGSSHSSTNKHSYWEGKALAPSTISAKQGSIRLLAVPSLLDVPAEKPHDAATIDRVRRYIEETIFTTPSSMKEMRAAAQEEYTDDDGMYRVDRTSTENDVDVASCLLEERHIKQGETVSAFGLYSSSRGGLVPHPNWAKQARIMRGDATTVANQLRNRMIRYFLGMLLFAAAAYGVVRLYEYHVRTQLAAIVSTTAADVA
jgi:hypothetical protein